MESSTLTDRGQVSVPAALRRAMKLKPGQRLRFEAISPQEFRVFVANDEPGGAMAALGYARRLRPGQGRRTSEWMRELREGERPS